MKKATIFIIILCAFAISCSKDNDSPVDLITNEPTTDPITSITITTNNFSDSIDENSANGTVLGSLTASASDNSTISYMLDNQSVSGAMALSNSGELTIADTAAFDYETNTQITANYTASSGSVNETGTITITINDIDVPFKVTVQPNASNEIIIGGFASLNGINYTYDFDIDWGDGSAIQTFTNMNTTRHTYVDANEYTITISGDMPHIQLQNGQAVNIVQWGEIEWELFHFSFFSNSDLQISATDTPNTSNVTTMQGMFEGCTSLNTGNFTNWNVSNVTNMGSLFRNCESFNQDISSWDVGNVTDMFRMFENAKIFNQDIGGWNVISATNMSGMFSEADTFNQDIGDWNVINVTSMLSMFLGSDAFNQDIGNWDVSSVTITSSMFQSTTMFNQDIGDWNVGNTVNMSRMFYEASAFNQDLTDWDVDNVTNSFEFGLNSSLTTANFPNF